MDLRGEGAQEGMRVRAQSSHKDVEQGEGGEQRLGGKTPWGYMNEEKTSLQLILLIEVEDIWRLLLYDSVLG